jgi:hypothetical protein
MTPADHVTMGAQALQSHGIFQVGIDSAIHAELRLETSMSITLRATYRSSLLFLLMYKLLSLRATHSLSKIPLVFEGLRQLLSLEGTFGFLL